MFHSSVFALSAVFYESSETKSAVSLRSCVAWRNMTPRLLIGGSSQSAVYDAEMFPFPKDEIGCTGWEFLDHRHPQLEEGRSSDLKVPEAMLKIRFHSYGGGSPATLVIVNAVSK